MYREKRTIQWPREAPSISSSCAFPQVPSRPRTAWLPISHDLHLVIWLLVRLLRPLGQFQLKLALASASFAFRAPPHFVLRPYPAHKRVVVYRVDAVLRTPLPPVDLCVHEGLCSFFLTCVLYMRYVFQAASGAWPGKRNILRSVSVPCSVYDVDARSLALPCVYMRLSCSLALGVIAEHLLQGR